LPGQVGAEWITLSSDDRKAVILSKFPDDRAIVLDFDTATAVKSCNNNPLAASSWYTRIF
jgi:hypothetical protein